MTTNFNAFVIYGTTFLQITLAVIYTDQWAVHIEGGPLVADEVANKHDFVNLGMVRHRLNLYVCFFKCYIGPFDVLFFFS